MGLGWHPRIMLARQRAEEQAQAERIRKEKREYMQYRPVLLLKLAKAGELTPEKVHEFKEEGIDLNARDDKNHGNTACHYVGQYGDRETFKALVEAGADVTIKNAKGEMALDFWLYMHNSKLKQENTKTNNKKRTRAEIRAEIMAHKKAIRMETEAHELAIQSLTSQLSQTTPERKALAKKLKEIRAEYAPDKALDAAANNKTVQKLRKQVKDAAER